MDRDSCWAREPENAHHQFCGERSCVDIFFFKSDGDAHTGEFSQGGETFFGVAGETATDFTRMRSILPFRQSRIIRLKSSRLSMRVPVRPSSAYTSTSSQSVWAPICSVYALIWVA